MRQPLPIMKQQSLITRRPSLIIRLLLTPQQHPPHTTERQPLPPSQHLTQRLHLMQRLHITLPLSTTLHQHLMLLHLSIMLLHPHMLLHLSIMLLLTHTMLHPLRSRKQTSLPLLKS